MSLTHGRKSCMGVHEVFLLPIVLISSFLHGQCIIHYFLVLPYPFINLRTRSLLRGWREGAVTPHVIKMQITFISMLINL
jgi:hypothetical protein